MRHMLSPRHVINYSCIGRPKITYPRLLPCMHRVASHTVASYTRMCVCVCVHDDPCLPILRDNTRCFLPGWPARARAMANCPFVAERFKQVTHDRSLCASSPRPLGIAVVREEEKPANPRDNADNRNVLLSYLQAYPIISLEMSFLSRFVSLAENNF